jgi:NTE family protein
VVGLALSGGAARGLAHIGVIQELEALGVQVHVISGTSMGSLVGGLYATGMDGAELERVARSFNEADIFQDQVPRNFLSPDQRLFDERLLLTLPIRNGSVDLPGGALEGGSVVRALEKATWSAQATTSFDQLPRPFVAVATDLRRGDAVPITDGGLAEAIRASVAIPGVFQPVERGEQLLVDGALVRNLPAQDARGLGAEFLICSDVAREPDAVDYDTVVEILSAAISIQSQLNIREQYDQCDVVLRPISNEFTSADFQELDYWIELGREEVREQASAIVDGIGARDGEGSLLQFLLTRTARERPPLPDSLVVARVRFQGLENPELEAPARRALGIPEGSMVNADDIDRALTALQATDLFDRISYRIVGVNGPDPADMEGPWALEIFLRPAQRDRLGLGVRFDDRYRASVLLSTTLLNRLGYGSSTRLDVRLGEELQFQLVHFGGRGVTSSVGLGFTGGFSRAPLRLAEAGVTRQELVTEQLYGAGLLTLAQRAGGFLALELRGERIWETDAVGSFAATGDFGFASGSLLGWLDSFDHPAFPTRGLYLMGRTEWSSSRLGADFSQHLVDARAAIPLAPRVSAHLELFAGLGRGTDLPLNRHFYLGGVNTSQVFRPSHPPLWGLSVQDRWGRVAQAAALALQWELLPGWFVQARANAGQVRDEWALDFGDWIGGWGVAVGSRTLLGPVQLTITGRERLDDLGVALNLGRAF